MGPYKLLQPPRRWSRPHEPTSIMANAQRKIRIKLVGQVYHTVLILIQQPTYLIQLVKSIFPITVKSPIMGRTVPPDTFPRVSKSSPKLSKIAERSLR